MSSETTPGSGPRQRVFYNSHGDAGLYDMLRQSADEEVELLLLDSDDDDERAERLGLADAVIVAARPFTRPLVEAATQLAIVHHQGVGYQDTIALDALAERGIPLAITPGGTTVGVAEHTVLLILSVLRRLSFADAELRRGRFHVNALRSVSRELSGRSVGLVGAGRIGQAVAERLGPFGVTLSYCDPVRLEPESEDRLGLVHLTFDELLASSDIVSLHLPMSAGSRHLIDAAALARMRPGAFLINTSRGGLVDEGALVDSLEAGRLAGAALDVMDREPPSLDHPLLGMPNVVLTPHISAGTRDAFLEKMSFVFANLRRFRLGQPVENLVAVGPSRESGLPTRAGPMPSGPA